MRRVDVAIEAAKVAGAVIQSRNGAELNIQEKDSSRTSIVTAADLRSQQEVIHTIRWAFFGWNNIPTEHPSALRYRSQSSRAWPIEIGTLIEDAQLTGSDHWFHEYAISNGLD